MEPIDYNRLFRWFDGFSMEKEMWDHSTFTKNRDRPLGDDVARRFFVHLLGQAERADLLSKEHFSVDGTMIEALGSQNSYRPKDEEDPPPRLEVGIAGSIFLARSPVATRTNRRQTKRPCCTRRVRAQRQS